jgi:transposase
MTFHRNAKLGLAGRLALVQSIEAGISLKAAAAAFSVSPATAHRWWHRWREASEQDCATRACLLDRSSRPHRSPRELAAELQERICACRRQTGWGPRLVAAATGFCHSTVWKVLKRAGISRPERPPREPANSYEWPCPGDLLHMDVSRFRPLRAPWPRRHRGSLPALAQVDALAEAGRLRLRARDRRRPLAARLRGAPSRRAGGDRHRLPRASARFLRAPRGPGEAADDRQRLRLRQESLAARLARPRAHPPPDHRALPAANEREVERFHQTMAREWAYRVVYRSHRERNQALPHWLDHYNRRRPHSSLGDRPPISRVHNVRG